MQRKLERRSHVEPGAPVEVGRPRQQENVVDIGKDARCERPQQ